MDSLSEHVSAEANWTAGAPEGVKHRKRLAARYDAYKRPLLVAIALLAGVGALVARHPFNSPPVQRHAAKRVIASPQLAHPVTAEARAPAMPALVPLSKAAPAPVPFLVPPQVAPPPLEYRQVPETADQLAAPFVRDTASTPTSSVQRANADFITIGETAYGTVEPGPQNHAPAIAFARDAASQGPQAGGAEAAGGSSTAMHDRAGAAGVQSPAVGQLPYDVSTFSGATESVAARTDKSDRIASPLQFNPADLSPFSVTESEDAQPAVLRAGGPSQQTTAGGDTTIPAAEASQVATAEPDMTRKSVSAGAVEYSIPLQIQGADAGDVKVRMEGDRLSISLASILFLVKARMDSAEFDKLNSSRNASAYISTDALRTAGFVIGFDPSKASLVMSTNEKPVEGRVAPDSP